MVIIKSSSGINILSLEICHLTFVYPLCVKWHIRPHVSVIKCYFEGTGDLPVAQVAQAPTWRKRRCSSSGIYPLTNPARGQNPSQHSS